MAKLKHLSEEEVQQITFDWRYKGFTTLELLTEEECDVINDELDRLRNERTGTEAPDGKIWGEWDPFAYPHKLSPMLEKYFAHPKILEAVEYLMGGEIDGIKVDGNMKRYKSLNPDAYYLITSLDRKYKFYKFIDGKLSKKKGDRYIPI